MLDLERGRADRRVQHSPRTIEHCRHRQCALGSHGHGMQIRCVDNKPLRPVVGDGMDLYCTFSLPGRVRLGIGSQLAQTHKQARLFTRSRAARSVAVPGIRHGLSCA